MFTLILKAFHQLLERHRRSNSWYVKTRTGPYYGRLLEDLVERSPQTAGYDKRGEPRPGHGQSYRVELAADLARVDRELFEQDKVRSSNLGRGRQGPEQEAPRSRL